MLMKYREEFWGNQLFDDYYWRFESCLALDWI